jgi:CcmD family protein
MEHFRFLFAAYSIIFMAIFLYVGFIWHRQARLQAEIEALEKRLESLNELRGREEASAGS